MNSLERLIFRMAQSTGRMADASQMPPDMMFWEFMKREAWLHLKLAARLYRLVKDKGKGY